MNCSWGNEQSITFLWINHIQNLLNCTVMTSVIELLSCYISIEAGVDLRTWLCIHHIPDLSLAQRIISFSSHFIVRVNLNREPVIDIKELYKQRKLSSIIIIYILAYYPLEICLHQIADCISSKPSVCNYRIFNTHICEFPAFADLFICRNLQLISVLITFYELLAQLRYKRIATPWSLGCHRYELHGI